MFPHEMMSKVISEDRSRGGLGESREIQKDAKWSTEGEMVHSGWAAHPSGRHSVSTRAPLQCVDLNSKESILPGGGFSPATLHFLSGGDTEPGPLRWAGKARDAAQRRNDSGAYGVN